jgi:hypothetical protein
MISTAANMLPPLLAFAEKTAKGFFIFAMGMGLIFHGVTEAIRDYLLSGAH